VALDDSVLHEARSRSYVLQALRCAKALAAGASLGLSPSHLATLPLLKPGIAVQDRFKLGG